MPRPWPRLKETHGTLGTHVGPDDVYLTLRGMRTLAVRLDRHAASAMKVATWLDSAARGRARPLPAAARPIPATPCGSAT